MKLKKLFLLVIACCLFGNMQAQITATGRLYVKSNAAGDGSGDSWANAVTDLAEALAYANKENIDAAGTVTEIWVAEGTYVPKYGTFGRPTNVLVPGVADMRTATFAVKRPIKIYGGFAGDEGSVSARHGGTTTLSGNLGADGKAYHVVYINVVTEAADPTFVGDYVIDGFTIEGGSADIIRTKEGDMPSYGSNPPSTTKDNLAATRSGGGIYALLQTGEKLTVTNNIIQGNTAFYAGGGMFCQIKSANATLKLSGNTFTGNATSPLHETTPVGYEYLNTAIGGGGGFCLRTAGNANKVTIEGNTFTQNNAWYRGGGAALYSDNVGEVEFIKNIVTSNKVTNRTYALTTTSKQDSVAGTGGGLHTYFIEDSKLTIGGSSANANTFSENEAESQGGGLYASTSSMENNSSTTPTAKTTISYNTFEKNKITVGSVSKTFIYGGAGLYAYTYNYLTNSDAYFVTLLTEYNTYKDNNAVSPEANKYNDGGGAIYSSDGKTKVTVQRETYYGNKADNYAGARLYASNGTIANFKNNTVGGANTGEPNIASGSYGGVGLLFAGAYQTLGYASNNTITYNKALFGYGGGVGIYVANYAKLYFGGDASTDKNTVKYNTAPMRGGGIDVGIEGEGHATIKYNEITNNTTTLYATDNGNPIGGGGGAYIYVGWGKPTVTIDDNTVTHNTSHLHGGGFCIRNDAEADLKLNRNTIENNAATTGNGGGIDIYSNGTSKLYVQDNNKINANQSQGTAAGNNCGGGGVYIAASSTPEIHILNNEIGTAAKPNSSATYGGGITLVSYESSKIFIKENTITKNTAVKGGGGIYSLVTATSDALISKNSIIENASTTDGIGGGIYSQVNNKAKLTIGGALDADKNTITNNTAAEKGAGIFVYSYAESPSKVLIQKNLINNNINTKKGGGIYTEARNAADLEINGNTIQNNAVSEDGGGIYADGAGATDVLNSKTLINNNTINGNSATISGGGVFATGTTLSAPSIIVQNNAITANTAKSTGAGVAVDAKKDVDSDIKVLDNDIKNNTITAAAGKVIKGAGVWVNARQGIVTVEDNTIEANKLTSSNKSAYGAGVYCENPQMYTDATIIVNRNDIDKNEISTAGTGTNALGGGIYAALQTEAIGKILISYNKIRANKVTATGTVTNLQGGGIYTDLYTAGDRPTDNPDTRGLAPIEDAITVINNLVAGNTLAGAFTGKGAGAGMYANTVKGGGITRTAYIVNNTIVANNISSSGGKAGGLGIGFTAYSTYTINVHNNIIHGNKAASALSNLDVVNNGNVNVINIANNFLGDLISITTDFPVADNNKIRLNNVVNGDRDLFTPEFKNEQADVFTSDYNLKPNARLAEYGNNVYYTAAGGDLDNDIDLNLSTANRKQGKFIAAGAYEGESNPPLTIWLGKTENWQDQNNWYPAQVPTSLTDVYIPGNKVIPDTDMTYDYTYPTLEGNKTDNVCDRMFFMPGAQLGRPDLLTYNKVHVEMNYGKGSLASQATLDYIDIYKGSVTYATVAAGTKGSDYDGDGTGKINSTKRIQFGAKTSAKALDRGRWNMLAAPLQEMVTGDFAFGGFPFSYIKKYDGTNGKTSTYIKGKWADFDNLADVTFEPGQGFGHYYYPYIEKTPYGMDNSTGNIQWDAAADENDLTAAAPKHIDGGNTQFGLALSNGILHFPFFADKTLSDVRREHMYSGGTSSFYIYAQSPLKSIYFLQWYGLTSKHEKIRTANSEKFIMENKWVSHTYEAGTFAAGDIVLVGNPYMSALDFDAFYTKNSGKIKKVYHIYKEPNTYSTYGTASGHGLGQNTTDKYIAPMQSFLVEVATGGKLDLVFETATMAKTSTSTFLRSEEQAPMNDYLTITASNPHGEVNTWIRQSSDASDLFCKDDFSKIIDNANNLPEVYTMALAEEGNQRALLVNSIQTNEVTVPIGFVSSYNGDVTLTVSGMDNYNANVFFVDVENNTEKEITGKESFVYTFENTFNEETPALEGRFALRFTPAAGTGIDDTDNGDGSIVAYTKNDDVFVHSTGGNLIKMIQIFDLGGRIILEKASIESSFCKLENALRENGVYVIKVYTEQENKSMKVIR